MSIEARVHQIFVDHICHGPRSAEVTDKAHIMEDLGADSLDMVELVMAFEEEFGIEILDEDAMAVQTVGDAVRYIRQRLGQTV